MAWISANWYLSAAEQKTNALEFWAYFYPLGWTLQAVAGMLGNIQSESTINPGIWQGLDSDQSVTSKGYGLVQWTPWTKYADWAGAGWQDNGPRECERIVWEKDNGVQFYATDAYPISFEEFAFSQMGPDYLAKAFLHNYERPAVYHDEQRAAQALTWYEFLGGQPLPRRYQFIRGRGKRGIHRTIYV